MNKQQIKHITNIHYGNLIKQIKKIAADFDVEAIHLFRVEYKKLRAFLNMISSSGARPMELKIARSLKKSYRISGTIRDLQLQQQRIATVAIQEIKMPMAYLHLLQKKINKLKPKLCNTFLDDPVANSKQKTDSSVPDRFSKKQYRKYVIKKQSAIYAIITSGNFCDDNIHAIRKIGKDLLYNQKKMEGYDLECFSGGTGRGYDVADLENLLTNLGIYQDKRIAIALLKPGWLKKINVFNREILESIKIAWVNEKEMMKQLLVQQLRSGSISWQEINGNSNNH